MTPEMEFATRCWAIVNDLALAFAFEPDEKVSATLNEVRANLEEQLSDVLVGANVVAVVEHLIRHVQLRKHELEQQSAATFEKFRN